MKGEVLEPCPAISGLLLFVAPAAEPREDAGWPLPSLVLLLLLVEPLVMVLPDGAEAKEQSAAAEADAEQSPFEVNETARLLAAAAAKPAPYLCDVDVVDDVENNADPRVPVPSGMAGDALLFGSGSVAQS
jgi:hypothetical protein